MCGNFGILAKREPTDHGFLPRRFRRLFQRLGEMTELRGQQAGGVAVMSAGGRFVGRKIVNPKRGDLTAGLLGAFYRRTLLRRLGGARPMPDIFHLVAHYRYGTSSRPSEIETHWHRWLAPRRQPVWSLDGKRLVRRRRVIENLITHNGDFDAWQAPWGVNMGNGCIGSWLADVLGADYAAQGDSAKIAGLMDLFLTQGQWLASVRLAYALRTGQALPQRSLMELSRIFDRVFQRWTEARLDAAVGEQDPPNLIGCANLAEVYAQNPEAVRRLVEALRQVSLAATREWPVDAKQWRAQIVGRAVNAFFNNDVYQATRLFMEHARGTFGLVTTTSLEPGRVVLAAERQPMFVGADPEEGILVYASEAAALKFACVEESDGRSRCVPYRLDLRDGDVVALQVREGTADNLVTITNRYRDDVPTTARITAEALEASGADLSANPEGIGGWIALRDNPDIEASAGTGPRDRVLDEMTAIPQTLDRIQRDWEDPAARNRRTADAFAERFLDGVRTWMRRHQMADNPQLNAELDLLVLGVENSLSVGQQFAEDVRRVFPYLHVHALDAVTYTEDPQRFPVGPATITLAISHSGQTFNTLDAVKFLQELHHLGKAGPVFVMTSEVDTLMGAAVGQGVRSGSPWGARVFTTGAVGCTAEPATLSAAAAHASLTQLLLRLIRDVQAVTDDGEKPFGLSATDDDLAKLEALGRLSTARAEAHFGRTAEGWDVETEERAGLLREGRYLSQLMIEPMLVFLITAAHLFVMLWIGWNPVTGANAVLYASTRWDFFDPTTPAGHAILTGFATAYFLFASIAFTLMLRLIQRRPLWDRVLVGRSLVIGDEPYVKDLLAQYVSKLFSLAYGFAGLAGVHAAATRCGELLHGYGHRISRGALLYLGMPDGRWCGRERAEAAVCMTSSQARGVQNLGAGATVFGIGHNPACASRVDRFIQLGVSGRCGDALPWVLRGDWSELARDLQESRFAAFERLLAGYVVFHTMAARTRDFINPLVPIGNLLGMPVFIAIRLLTRGRARPRFGRWDLARTQSGTRIATTAAPVAANTCNPESYRVPREHFAEAPQPRHKAPSAELPLNAALAARPGATSPRVADASGDRQRSPASWAAGLIRGPSA